MKGLKSNGDLDTRSILIREGRRILEEGGVGALGLRSTALRARVSHQTPSFLFGDRAGLLSAIAAQGFEELAEARRGIIDRSPDPRDLIAGLLSSYVSFARTNPGLFHLMFGPELAQRSDYPLFRKAAFESFTIFADAIQTLAESSGWSSKEARLIIMTAWAIEHGIADLGLSGQYKIASEPFDIDDLVPFASALLSNALLDARPAKSASARRRVMSGKQKE